MNTEMNTENMTLALLAKARQENLAIVWDGDDAALLRRHYDDDGRQVVRYRPDPRDFHPVEEFFAENWRSLIC